MSALRACAPSLGRGGRASSRLPSPQPLPANFASCRYVFADGRERDCIYQRSRRICWNDELMLGRRVAVRWSPVEWREGTITGFDSKTGKHLLRYDLVARGGRWTDLGTSEFRILQQPNELTRAGVIEAVPREEALHESTGHSIYAEACPPIGALNKPVWEPSDGSARSNPPGQLTGWSPCLTA